MIYWIRYSPAAQKDADVIWENVVEYLGDYDKADGYIEGIADEISSVREYPKSGSPLYYGRLFTGFYWVIYRKHKVFYRIRESWIEVVRILDARSDYMKVLFGEGSEYSSDPYVF